VLVYKYKTFFMVNENYILAQIVNTGQMQHNIPYKHGLFQVYNCK